MDAWKPLLLIYIFTFSTEAEESGNTLKKLLFKLIAKLLFYIYTQYRDEEFMNFFPNYGL